MATHDANIENLRTATLGEQVRGSMIQLFEEDYNLVKRGITIGTDVNSASSPITDYYDGNVYINSDTLDVFKLIDDVWTWQGNLKGIADIVVTQISTADSGTNIITFILTDGTTKSFNIRNGSKGSTGVSVRDVVDNGDGTFHFVLDDGTETADIATIRGLQGVQGVQGIQGIAGRDVVSFTMSGTGKQHTITANYSDGTSQLVGILEDGADGSGTGDMVTTTYDPTKSGVVNSARALSDGITNIPMSTVALKADHYTKAETNAKLSDKLDNPATEGTSGQALVTDGEGGRSWQTVQTEQYINSVSSDFGVSNKKLSLSNATKNKIDSTPALISDAFGAKGEDYVAGEYCIYNNILYKANGNTSYRTFEASKWDAVNAGSEFKALNDNLKTTNDKLKGVTSSTVLAATIPNAKATGVAKITLPKGKWLVLGRCRFAGNATGNRAISIGTSVTFSWATAADIIAPSNATTAITTGFTVLDLAEDSTVYLTAYQTSTAELGINSVYLAATQI